MTVSAMRAEASVRWCAYMAITHQWNLGTSGAHLASPLEDPVQQVAVHAHLFWATCDEAGQRHLTLARSRLVGPPRSRST
eukprot:COSAG02_NODE_11484_length_1715_cov_2.844678_1_plen_80_part_00